MEKDHLILTAIGPDQVGLVQKISEFISRHGCNIEDSKMAVFCGEFAVIVLISGDSASLVEISRCYPEIEKSTGLAVSVKIPSSRTGVPSILPYALTVSCMDHPGIVYQISAVLSALGVNIESMETETYAAPVSGTPIFRLEAELSVPASTNLNALRQRFSELQTAENIDIELVPLRG